MPGLWAARGLAVGLRLRALGRTEAGQGGGLGGRTGGASLSHLSPPRYQGQEMKHKQQTVVLHILATSSLLQPFNEIKKNGKSQHL